MKQFEIIEFYGKKFNAPNPITEYLTYQFGDWQVRKRTDDKSIYMTPKFYKRDNFIISFAKTIINKLKKII